MRKPWWKQISFILTSVAVAFLIVGLSASEDWKVPLTIFGITLLVLFVTVPYFIAIMLCGLRLPRQAARYAGWASQHYPLPAHRAHCALLATHVYSSIGDTMHSLECAGIGMALSEKRLDKPQMRTVYAQCLNAKGTDALNRGQYREALDAFSLPLRMKMDNPLFNALYYSNSSTALYSLGRFPEALTMVEHARALAAGSEPAQQQTRAVTHHNAAFALAEMGRTAEALSEIKEALALKLGAQTQALIQTTYAWALWLNGDLQGAETAFQECEPLLPLKETSVTRMFYRLRGLLRVSENRCDEARADLLKSLGGSEVPPASYYHLARLADKLDNPAEADEWRERLLREVPESFYAQRVRAEKPGMV